MYAFEEEGFGDRRDGDEGGGVCEAFGVVGGAEDGYAVVWAAEGLHALVGLLAVVERWSHAMETEVRVGYESRCGPDAGLDGVVALNVAVDCQDVSEGQLWGRVIVGDYPREL